MSAIAWAKEEWRQGLYRETGKPLGKRKI